MERYDSQYGSKGKVFDSVVVSGERTVYSDPIPIGGSGNFGVWYKATSVLGSPNLRLFYQVSYDETLANFATPNNVSDIVYGWTSGETVVVDSISPPAMPWIRFGAQGLSGNANDTILTEVLVNV